ncbi:MAG: RluA family pseudouridine synthase [Lachnospiraceae bacterium]|nr:RluA family pseudouridine synthase [Lachnospiraceae bacterium]
MRNLSVGPADAGQRLDKFLVRTFKEAEKGFLYRMLRKKNITLNGSKAAGNEMLKAGDQIEVYFSDETFEKFRGTAGKVAASAEESAMKKNGTAGAFSKQAPSLLSVVYEDEALLFVNKPAGLLSQKAGRDDDCLADRIAAYTAAQNAAKPESARSQGFTPAPAHRLDRNTSGLVLAGKTLPGQQLLSFLLRERELEKYYLCVVKGRLEKPLHSVLFWQKDEADNTVTIRKEAVPGAEKVELTARTERSLERGYSLLKVRLISGKSHQIRAQLAFLGLPIAGDAKYGSADVNRELAVLWGGTLRVQLLHSFEAVFPAALPEEAGLSEEARQVFERVAGKSFQAPLPPVFISVIKALGGGSHGE